MKLINKNIFTFNLYLLYEYYNSYYIHIAFYIFFFYLYHFICRVNFLEFVYLISIFLLTEVAKRCNDRIRNGFIIILLFLSIFY
jgi:hypothetical protein